VRRRVLYLVAATTLLVLVAFLVPLAVLVKNVASDRAVQAATVRAQALTALVGIDDRASLELAVRQVDAEVTVFLADGTRIGAPAERTPLVRLGLRGGSESVDVAGGREIVFAVSGPSGPVGAIRTFVPDSELSVGVGRSWLLLAGLGLTLLAVSLLVADRLARSLVRSTNELAAVSHRLAAGELTARASVSGPGELGVVGAALNGLAGRITELLAEERETVADISHRVRTPLTTLRMDAETLRDPDESARIVAGVEAVNQAVTDVIATARQRGGSPPAVTDASAVVAERVAFWQVLAEDTDRTVTVSIAPGPLPLRVSRADLEACVDALLGNVFAHTPNGVAFGVTLSRVDGYGRLEVSDAGPGLASGAVLGRGVSGAGSSGLGLDIVRRAARESGGGMSLRRSTAGGLLVSVDFGLGQ
jgi:signal transduction histidine kinase